MARLFPRHAVDRFLEHNVFYTRGQCTIQEGWNGFRRGASRSGGHGNSPGSNGTDGVREGDVPNCSGKLHDPGKLAFRRLGILPQQLRTSPLFALYLTPSMRKHQVTFMCEITTELGVLCRQ